MIPAPGRDDGLLGGRGPALVGGMWLPGSAVRVLQVARVSMGPLKQWAWADAIEDAAGPLPAVGITVTDLADAAWPLIRMRGRWLLIDPDTARRARHRELAPVPSLDALAAALSGTLTLDGETLDVRPAGTLVDALRQARLANGPPAVANLVANRIPSTIADSGHACGISIVPSADGIAPAS
ncbi:hypothetical protein [Streptomyces flaveolus]|uniref:hypothetical protein n=1 Tax=Streptomyces flaveolus TaxID=67297 RepID=UPI0033D1D0DE